MTVDPTIICLDVDYRDRGAIAAGVWFRGWNATESLHQVVVPFESIAEYEPGSFFKRELPCLLGALNVGPPADIVIVDGYVWLGPTQPGLGKHLFDVLNSSVAVIGVAKTRFHGATTAVPLCRGESTSPLFITAEGITIADAVAGVKSMFGPYRVPKLLRDVDRLCRTGV